MSKFKSRKLWMAIIAALLIVANQGFELGLPEEAINKIAMLVMSYILGQGAVDAVGGLKK